MRRAIRNLAAALIACAGMAMAFGAGAAVQSAPATPAAAPLERSLGSPTAPVTVIEYASVGCPHCATFANTVFPAFKARFIDTGKVRFVFREMLTGDPELAAEGFLLANCAPPDKYFQVVDAIFADQIGIARGGGEALFKIADSVGMTRPQFEACMTNEAALEALETETNDDAKLHGVEGTPTFVVGDEKLAGELSLDQLSAAIARARR